MLRRFYERATSSSSTETPRSADPSDNGNSMMDIKLDQLEHLDLEGAAEGFGGHEGPTILTRAVSRESYEEGSYDEHASYYDPNMDDDSVVEIEDDSPYPEVRSAVANTDDPNMPASTFRAWCLGIICAIIIPGLNQFMFFRWPSVAVGGLVAQLVSYPVGQLWARVVPAKTVFGIQLNPGPFTVKEHVIVTIMSGVGSRSAYATDIVAVQRKFYNQNYNFFYQWTLVMSTQLIGFSIGGICRRFLVSPASMIWPDNLVLCALFNTLHSQQYIGMGEHKGMSREKFFIYALLISTAYYFFPGYLFTALSYFSWVCWIAPNNVALKQMFGYASGMGMSMLTFDWTQIGYIGSPLATPWWAAVNITAGFVIFYWVLTPILYFSNVWNSQYMPIISRNSYDNAGHKYNVSLILTPDCTLDLDKYHAYSPLYIPTAFAVSYGLSFASITATIVHTILYFRNQLRLKGRGALVEQPDIHARLMAVYKPVPQMWYLIIFLVMFAFAIISVEVWPTQMPVWALVVALLLAFVYTIPIGMIQAITNQQIGLNVIAELIVGYAVPGKPIAMMMFKTWGYISMSQALKFTSDFKLGHYMKVPLRPMFWCQVVATAIAGTVQLGVQSWMFTNIPGMCDSDQPDGFICANTEVFYTASIIWGVIGPALQFSKGMTYQYVLVLLLCDPFTHHFAVVRKRYGVRDINLTITSALMYFFLLGAILPLIPWAISRRYPNSFFKYINVPLILGGTSNSPPATAVNYVPWAIVGFIFQYVIRRRHFSWWAKYNYVLSAALDSSVAIGAMLIFFALQFPLNGSIGANTIQKWWGNSVYQNTADWNMLPVKQLPQGEIFGPTWPSLYNPAIELLHIANNDPIQPKGHYLHKASDVYLFTLYWTLILYTPTFTFCGVYAFLNIVLAPTFIHPIVLNDKPHEDRLTASTEMHPMTPLSSPPASSAGATHPLIHKQFVPSRLAPPRPNERRTRLAYALIVLFVFLAAGVLGAVLGSLVIGYILVGLFRAAKFNMST
ncbi:small oligopeptide transporter [Rickenella mellea]|uniref:Small oligopeptide transporter n=1 Tax=Rickenella mellea TaxID=50990 RepID=A0A4Y7Q8A5_9AGAM|nr:small oligopeptide transporter [Rickenella mellea]